MMALEREVTAWKLLHDPAVVGGLSEEETYELCVRAGYGEEASRRAAKGQGRENWKRGLK